MSRFNHVGPQFAVRDVTVAVSFYSTVLGFGVDYLDGDQPSERSPFRPSPGRRDVLDDATTTGIAERLALWFERAQDTVLACDRTKGPAYPAAEHRYSSPQRGAAPTAEPRPHRGLSGGKPRAATGRDPGRR